MATKDKNKDEIMQLVHVWRDKEEDALVCLRQDRQDVFRNANYTISCENLSVRN